MVRHNVLKGLYEIEKTIGCGGFAKVKLATHLATGEKVAIKIMDKKSLGDSLHRVKLELKALKNFSHQHVCKLHQVIETETHFFIVIEYCSGGELFDHIIEKTRLSEGETRMFFRQIVSAVAYVHSLGYAHRDLKPENVLLDKYQNLKLIDFGLCAKPEGGIESPLVTSCGSPTSAAPELVKGKEYLGPEVDVWAMGVMLYTLLAGRLPFDDVNINGLFEKILAGKYLEPSFMTKESLNLIKSMLQVDPKKRITITELLSHPWLTLGVLEPVQFKPEASKVFDSDCVNVMAKHYQMTPENMWTYLKTWRYDYYTSTYFLLLAKKKRGSSLKLYHVSTDIPLQVKAGEKRKHTLKPLVLQDHNDKATNTPKNLNPQTPTSDFTLQRRKIESTPKTPKCQHASSPANGDFTQPKPSRIRKPQKRIRSPNLDGDFSPVPTKKQASEKSTPLRTPECSQMPATPESSASSRGVLGSLERSLHKVRHVLKARKTASECATHPVSLTSKNLCNVSTTQSRDPEFVINELSKALEKKGIHCDRKGYTLRGKVEPNVIYRLSGCSFELEICYLPSLGPSLHDTPSSATPTKSILVNGLFNFNTPTTAHTKTSSSSTPTPQKIKESKLDANEFAGFVGIRRKRLKGDSWCYKKVCEEVLALTNMDLRPPVIESAV